MSAVELPGHPDPHAWTWTDAEKRAILKWGEGLRASVLEEALAPCNELLALSARQARDGDHFEIGREAGHQECIDAIRALSGPKGQGSV